MGVAHVDLAGPAVGELLGLVGSEHRLPHVHRRHGRPGRLARQVLDGPHPGQGHRERRGATSRPPPRPGPGTACRSAHLGDAAVGVPEFHGQVGPPAGETRITRRHRHRAAGRTGRAPVPVRGARSSAMSTRTRSRCRPHGAWSGGGLGALASAGSSCCRTVSHPGAVRRVSPEEGHDRRHRVAVRLHHTIRGSRRNQAICRRAKARVRRTAWSTARPAACRLRGGPAAPGSRGPGGPFATGPRAGRPADGPRRGTRPPSDGRTVRRCGGRGRPGRGGSRPTTPVSAGSARVRAEAENGRPDPEVTSSARTSRRRLEGAMRPAATGSSWASRSWRASRARPRRSPRGRRRRARLERRGHRRVATGKGQVVDQGPQVEPGPTHQQSARGCGRRCRRGPPCRPPGTAGR